MSNDFSVPWLSELDVHRHQAISQHAATLWNKVRDPQAYTPHDPAHFQRVESIIRSLIPKERWCLLNEEERFLLSCAAWTHDIAMNPAAHLLQHEKTDAQIRKHHVDESADWVLRERRTLRLSISEATVLSEVNRHHSRKYRIEQCADSRICNSVIVRPRLLAAYLRLADAMEVAHERVDEGELQRFLMLQEGIAKKSQESLFHWIKSFIVSGITPCHVTERLTVEFQIDQSEARRASSNSVMPLGSSIALQDAISHTGFEILTRFILEELNDELESVEEVLATGGISSYHFVRPSLAVVVLPQAAMPQWSSGLMRVVNDLRVAHSPNSTGTADAALSAIGDTLNVLTRPGQHSSPFTRLRPDEILGLKEPIPQERIAEVMPHLRKNLQIRAESRLCHAELQRIKSFVVDLAVKMVSRPSTEDCRGWLAELADYEFRMRKMLSQVSHRDGDLSKSFWRHCNALINKSHPEVNRLSVLLFGNSATVANVLASYGHYGVEELFCYVAEGRPKTQHGARNVPTYLDAVAYAATLRDAERARRRSTDGESEFQTKKCVIRIIPDIAIGTVLDGVHAKGRDDQRYPKVDVVVFGANGIVVDEDVTIAHTCGHLAIAATAKQLHVPVYVVAAAAKIQSPPDGEWQCATRDERAKWIASENSGVIDLLKRYDVEYDWNPREDHVPSSMLDAIFTEYGLCECTMPADAVAECLRAWKTKVDELVGQSRIVDGKTAFVSRSQCPVAQSVADDTNVSNCVVT